MRRLHTALARDRSGFMENLPRSLGLTWIRFGFGQKLNRESPRTGPASELASQVFQESTSGRPILPAAQRPYRIRTSTDPAGVASIRRRVHVLMIGWAVKSHIIRNARTEHCDRSKRLKRIVCEISLRRQTTICIELRKSARDHLPKSKIRSQSAHLSSSSQHSSGSWRVEVFRNTFKFLSSRRLLPPSASLQASSRNQKLVVATTRLRCLHQPIQKMFEFRLILWRLIWAGPHGYQIGRKPFAQESPGQAWHASRRVPFSPLIISKAKRSH